MKLKNLKCELQALDSFTRPNIALEQYATLPDDAADILDIVKSFGDLDDKFIGDLGCGCGVFSIGAALFDAGHVVGFDIDKNALEISSKNKHKSECDNVDFIQCDVLDLENSKWQKTFDTIITNPPFGTKDSKGIDMKFVKTALSLADTVYSLHKSVTVPHIEKVCKLWNIEMQSLYEILFPLPKLYKRHSRETIDVKVTLIRYTSLKSTIS